MNKDEKNYNSIERDHKISTHQIQSDKIRQRAGFENLKPNYFIGSLQQKPSEGPAFVLTPLNNFHQFRPGFDYVDEEKASRSIKKSALQSRSLAEEQNAKGAQASGTKWTRFHNVNLSGTPGANYHTKECLGFGLEQEDAQMNGGTEVEVKQNRGYINELAPLTEDTLQNDFSTSSIYLNKQDKPETFDFRREVLTIMQKCQVIDLQTLVRNL
mmetsp:Transcript_33352/g.51123  ORF Transcript_33352/g.51123 Transcript_33352/m.51123 type:complete len:213 (+) Transcript_33352:311-949(+)